MKKLDLDQPERKIFARSEGGSRFILLGEERTERPSPQVRRKLRRTTRAEVPGLWGTLGMADESVPRWKGLIRFSKQGSRLSKAKDSYQATMQEIDHVRAGHSPSIRADRDKATVTERFISFEDVVFPDYPKELTIETIPKLRLTLMLAPDEGALVFYQHAPPGPRAVRRIARGDGTDGSAAEYILPLPTPGHDCSGRDRLHYHVPILPPQRLRPTGEGRFRLGGRKHGERFVLKILTFKRANSESGTILGGLAHHLQGHTHQLLIWNPSLADFEVRDGSAVNADAKTLLLIHGTFSETRLAYAGLLEGGSKSWIAGKFGTGAGQYRQILGFDHPTLSEGPKETVLALLERLPHGFSFASPIDVITHSRGGLVGKWMALNANQVPVGRGALVACANGVGYFKAGWGVAKLLTVAKALLKGTGHPVLSYITGFAQHSAEYFLNLPGCRAMTPGSDFLNSIVTAEPAIQHPTYLPVVGDFTREVVKDEGLFKRWGAYGLDLMIKPLLGMDHDWVVGTREQYLMPKSSYPPKYAPGDFKGHTLAARHSDYFYAGRTKTQKLLDTFLV